MEAKGKPYPAGADAEEEEVEIIEIVGMDEDGEEIVFEEEPLPEPEAPAPAEPSPPDYREHAIRLQAEFENLKKRTDREKEEHRRFASVAVVERLLPIIDNFERALASRSAEEGDGTFLQGIRLIYRQMMDELRREGLTPIEAVGRPFDPNLHEAVETCLDEDHPPNMVVEEVLKGYRFLDRVLRPALVKVNLEKAEGGMDVPSGRTE